MARIQTHAIRALDKLGIPYQVVMHAHKARNLEEAAAERGVPVHQVVHFCYLSLIPTQMLLSNMPLIHFHNYPLALPYP